MCCFCLFLFVVSVVLVSFVFVFVVDVFIVIFVVVVYMVEQLCDKVMYDDIVYCIVEGFIIEIGLCFVGGFNDQCVCDWVVVKMKVLGFDKVYIELVSYLLWECCSESGVIVVLFLQKLVFIVLGYLLVMFKGGFIVQVVVFFMLDVFKVVDLVSIKGCIVYVGVCMQCYKDGCDYGIGLLICIQGLVIVQVKGVVGFLLCLVGIDLYSCVLYIGVIGFIDLVKMIFVVVLVEFDVDQFECVFVYGQLVQVKMELDCGIIGQYIGVNVIGQIIGCKYLKQIVDIGGYLDLWDFGIGVIDDGVGVVIVMGVVKLIYDLLQCLDCIVCVIVFVNEEMGLFGG